MLSERQLWAALRRGMPIIIAAAMVAAAVGAGVSLLLPHRYVATQELAVAAPLVSISEFPRNDVSQTRLLSTDAELLASDSVLSRAAESTNTTGRALEERLSVSADGNSDLITVSITAASVARATAELEAIIAAAQRAEVGTERVRIETALAGVDQEIESSGDQTSEGAVSSGGDLASLRAARANLTAVLASLSSSMQPVAAPTTRAADLGPGLPVSVALGFVGGAFLATSLVVARARLQGRLVDAEYARALGVPVLAGPGDSLGRAAKRVFSTAIDDATGPAPLVILQVGAPTLEIEEALAVQASERNQAMRLVQVGGVRSGSVRPTPEGHDGVTRRLVDDEDSLFSDLLRRELSERGEAWLVVSLTASEEAAIRASTVVGSVVLVVQEGDRAAPLAQMVSALRQAQVQILGAVVVMPASARKARGERRAVGATAVLPAEASRS